MSQRNMNTNGKNNNKKFIVKPFCKVCFDTGKPEAEYTSHFVKTEPGVKGKVCCPTLLSQACTYCREPGHTVSHCLKLKQHNKNKEHALRVQEYAAKQIEINDSSNTTTSARIDACNGFSALARIDDQYDKLEAIQSDQLKAYPALCLTPAAAIPATKQAPVSYAHMAGKTGSVPSNALAAASVMTDLNKLAAIAIAKRQAVEKPVEKPFVKQRWWADWTDSDDDDDDDDCNCDF